MSNIRLVLTDIDGTLVEVGQHMPSAAVRHAMEALRTAAIPVVAVTARPYELARDLFVELGLRGPGIFDGGASIRDVENGEILWQNWLDVERLQTIAAILLPHVELIDFFPIYKMVSPAKTSLDDIVEPAPYVWALVKLTAWDESYKQLQALPNLNVHPGVGRPDKPGYIDVQITDVRSDKFHSVVALRHLVQSSKARTLAIGDSSNDLPLFANAGVTVAMGNAIPELKEVADHVVGTVQADGWAEAMNSFVLI